MPHPIVEAPYLWLIPAFPLLGMLFNAALGARAGRSRVGVVAPAVVGLSFLTACYALAQLLGAGEGAALHDRVYPWIAAGSLHLDVAFNFDPLSAVMTLVVTGVGFLIHVYSTGYMAKDEDYARYFTYLNLFTFAMLLLVLADNMVLLFVGWEGVGLCSYLLIGFWYQDNDNANAGKKAFIVNRIGDAGFLLGLFLLFWHLGAGTHGLTFREIAAHAGEISPGVVTAICVLLFVGATGKVGADSALRLAARRHGRPDAGQRPDPRRDDGHGRRLHDRAAELPLRPVADRDGRGGDGRRAHRLLRRDHRPGAERHQEGARLLHGEPARLHVPGARRRRLRARASSI